MTEAAQQFITPVTLRAVNREVYASQWDASAQHGAHQPHARGRCGARRAGQRRLRAKLLHGRAGDLLSLLVLRGRSSAARCWWRRR